jgi:hypothetical protein
MTHDVFISYSTKDKPVADTVCATLESIWTWGRHFLIILYAQISALT